MNSEEESSSYYRNIANGNSNGNGYGNGYDNGNGNENGNGSNYLNTLKMLEQVKLSPLTAAAAAVATNVSPKKSSPNKGSGGDAVNEISTSGVPVYSREFVIKLEEHYQSELRHQKQTLNEAAQRIISQKQDELQRYQEMMKEAKTAYEVAIESLKTEIEHLMETNNQTKKDCQLLLANQEENFKLEINSLNTKNNETISKIRLESDSAVEKIVQWASEKIKGLDHRIELELEGIHRNEVTNVSMQAKEKEQQSRQYQENLEGLQRLLDSEIIRRQSLETEIETLQSQRQTDLENMKIKLEYCLEAMDNKEIDVTKQLHAASRQLVAQKQEYDDVVNNFEKEKALVMEQMKLDNENLRESNRRMNNRIKELESKFVQSMAENSKDKESLHHTAMRFQQLLESKSTETNEATNAHQSLLYENKILQSELKLIQNEEKRLREENLEFRREVARLDKIIYGKSSTSHQFNQNNLSQWSGASGRK